VANKGLPMQLLLCGFAPDTTDIQPNWLCTL
jgi:hypothetical protein